MRLKNVKIKGFRCHEDLVTDVGNVTVLIGANDCGKSAVLEALDFLLNATQVGEQDLTSISGRRAEEVVVEGVFEFGDRDGQTAFGRPGQEVSIRRRANPGARPVAEILTERYLDEQLNEINEALPNTVLDPIIDRLGIQRPGPGVYTKNQKVADILRWAEANSPRAMGWSACPADLLGHLPEYLSFSADVALTAETGPLQNLFRQHARAALEQEQAAARQIEEALAQSLAEQEQTLSEVVREQMPSITWVHAVPLVDLARGLTVDLQVEDQRGNRTPFASRGHGVQRMVLLAVFRLTSRMLRQEGYHRDIIWGFDEPEIFLHPGAQRIAYRMIHDLVEWGLQAVIATHSTVFVDRTNIRSITLLEQDDEGAAHTRAEVSEDAAAVDAFLDAIRSGLGLRNSDVFYENAFLVVEGGTEANALPTLFALYTGNTFDALGIRLVDGESASNATGLVKFLVDTRKPVVAMLDTDASRPQSSAALSVRRLQNRGVDLGSDLFLVGKDTFEDSFGDDVLAQALHDAFATGGPQAITAADIASWRTQLGADEKLVVRLGIEVGQRYRAQFRKPVLGASLGRVIQTVGEIPLVVRQTFDRLQERAGQ